MNLAPVLFEHLRGLELALQQRRVRASHERLDALLADDFCEIGANGRRFGKAEVLKWLPEEAGVSFDAEGFQGRELAPDLVLLHYTSSRHDANGVRRTLRSSVWRKEPGGWRMTFHQGTRAATAATMSDASRSIDVHG